MKRFLYSLDTADGKGLEVMGDGWHITLALGGVRVSGPLEAEMFPVFSAIDIIEDSLPGSDNWWWR